MCAVAQKLRGSPLTAALGMMGVDRDRIETPSSSGGKEAAEAWLSKEVVYIVS